MADDLPELSERERKFCELYAGECAGNGVKAARLAGYAPDSGDYWTLATQASRMLKRADIQATLAAFQSSDPLVANRVERIRWLTAVMRGEVKEKRISCRDEDGSLTYEDVEPSIRDRLAAQESLSKISGEQVTKVANTNAAGDDVEGLTLAQLLALARIDPGKLGGE